MTFREYYGPSFQTDLIGVISGLTALHEHGSGEPAIQPRTLSSSNPLILKMSDERRQLFASALFFTVLIDQVCYTYFQGVYDRFRALTMYPKWIGDCPGGCYHNLHPSSVFRAIGSPIGPAYNWNGRVGLAVDAVAVMKAEVNDFFNSHMPDVNGLAFWNRCRAEIPSALATLDIRRGIYE